MSSPFRHKVGRGAVRFGHLNGDQLRLARQRQPHLDHLVHPLWRHVQFLPALPRSPVYLLDPPPAFRLDLEQLPPGEADELEGADSSCRRPP